MPKMKKERSTDSGEWFTGHQAELNFQDDNNDLKKEPKREPGKDAEEPKKTELDFENESIRTVIDVSEEESDDIVSIETNSSKNSELLPSNSNKANKRIKAAVIPNPTPKKEPNDKSSSCSSASTSVTSLDSSELSNDTLDDINERELESTTDPKAGPKSVDGRKTSKAEKTKVEPKLSAFNIFFKNDQYLVATIGILGACVLGYICYRKWFTSLTV